MAAQNVTMEIEAIPENEEKHECDCCCDKFNKSTRMKIECPNPECGYNACKSCARQYVLSTTELPHCMDCKVRWNQRFIVNTLNSSFVNNEYKKHRRDLLTERQMSMLPETMPAVAEFQRREEHEKKQSAIGEKISELKRQIEALKRERTANDIAFYQESGNSEKKEKQRFILPCPDEECRGYLSTAYRCELCENYACPKCLVITGKERHDPDHVCDEELVKTTELIRQTSKPCPSCGERIMKASGCDQMWCTKCQTAFSWRTGKIDTGHIHNPHFFQYQNQGRGNVAVRNPGDIICGGLPNNWWQIRITLRNMFGKSHKVMLMKIIELFDSLAHVSRHELVRSRQQVTELNNHQGLRVDYLMKKISKEHMTKELGKRDKKREKTIEMLHLYELFVTVGSDLINHICQTVEETKYEENRNTLLCEEFNKKLNEYDSFVSYINNELKHISVAYNTSVPHINTYNYAFETRVTKKYSKRDL